MKVNFNAYVPLDKTIQNRIVDWSTALNFMVLDKCPFHLISRWLKTNYKILKSSVFYVVVAIEKRRGHCQAVSSLFDGNTKMKHWNLVFSSWFLVNRWSNEMDKGTKIHDSQRLFNTRYATIIVYGNRPHPSALIAIFRQFLGQLPLYLSQNWHSDRHFEVLNRSNS